MYFPAAFPSGQGSAVPPPPSISAEDEAKYKLLRNDHNQEFVDIGEPPQNFIREADTASRFSQYPRWSKLMQAKDQVHQARVHPPQWLRCDLRNFDLTSLGTNFDVLLIDPPWEEYVKRTPDVVDPEGKLSWTLDELKNLPIDAISETPSFIFIWAGATHLDDARALLQHWGFRRCEDITWLKRLPFDTGQAGLNLAQIPPSDDSKETLLNEQIMRLREQVLQSRVSRPSLGYQDEEAVLRRVKEHCLMGLKGLVRRSLDSHIAHANIDTDVIVDAMPQGRDPNGLLSTRKPVEVYEIIERFALGRRKIELFGTYRSIRSGWLTLGLDMTEAPFDAETNLNIRDYISWFENVYGEKSNPTGGWDDPPNFDGGSAADFLGINQQVAPMAGLFKPAANAGAEASAWREERPLENKNAYPNMTTHRGGRYEGSSQALEFLRPKSPTTRTANDRTAK